MIARTLMAVAAAVLAGCAAPPPGGMDARPALSADAAAAAVADPARPQADRDRDALRKPAEMLAFSGVRPGDTVVDVIPGGGYFTRLFARAVGPEGRVFAYVPSEIAQRFNSEANARAVAAAYPNVTIHVSPLAGEGHGGAADVVFTAQNYHDLHTPLFGGADVAAFNRAVFDLLKPGGAYVIVDHRGHPGSGVSAANTLHRIDPEAVKREVTAAGFVLEGGSDALRNPADPHTANVFDPAIRGRTDQFALRFRKPG